MAATSVGNGRQTKKWQPLSLPWRMFFYALQAYFIEVNFAAAVDLFASGNLALRGWSSVWALIIYSVAAVIMEKIRDVLKPRGYPLAVIAFAHMCCMYLCEFTSGCILKPFGACYWTYEGFRFNIAGLVTLEYAPLWYFLGVVFEIFYAPNLFRLGWIEHVD
ncbi:hypothetical protein MTO96_024714 [Rhipicephalus appendiculatus]